MAVDYLEARLRRRAGTIEYLYAIGHIAWLELTHMLCVDHILNLELLSHLYMVGHIDRDALCFNSYES